VFFTGAGFSRAATGKSPVGDEFSRRVCDRFWPKGDPDIYDGRYSRLARFVSDYYMNWVHGSRPQQPRLEDLLTLLDFSIKTDSHSPPGAMLAAALRGDLMMAILGRAGHFPYSRRA